MWRMQSDKVFFLNFSTRLFHKIVHCVLYISFISFDYLSFIGFNYLCFSPVTERWSTWGCTVVLYLSLISFGHLCFIGFDYLCFLPVTEREVPDGALPHGQGVRSVEAGPGVSDRRQCQGHLCPSHVVLPRTSTEGTCCDCVLRLLICVMLCILGQLNLFVSSIESFRQYKKDANTLCLIFFFFCSRILIYMIKYW